MCSWLIIKLSFALEGAPARNSNLYANQRNLLPTKFAPRGVKVRNAWQEAHASGSGVPYGEG